jgi:hypothetical protein
MQRGNVGRCCDAWLVGAVGTGRCMGQAVRTSANLTLTLTLTLTLRCTGQAVRTSATCFLLR